MSSVPPQPLINAAHRKSRSARVIRDVGIVLLASVVLFIHSGAQNEIEGLESLKKDVNEFTTKLEKSTDQNLDGIAIGCYNNALTNPHSPRGAPSILDAPKVKAMQDYLEVAAKLAREYEQYVSATETLIKQKWPDTPLVIKIHPWYNGRYFKLRNEIDTRLSWVKGQLADHSCTKHLR
jgi:hypothetical protein